MQQFAENIILTHYKIFHSDQAGFKALNFIINKLFIMYRGIFFERKLVSIFRSVLHLK